MKRLFLPAAFLLAICSVPFARGAEPDLVAHFEKILEPLLPGVEVTQVKQAPVGDLYEVMMGSSVLYVTFDGAYAVRGDLVDLKNRRNLTDAAKDQVRSKALSSVDPKTMISFVPETKTKLELFVFTDIDCSFCRKLHSEMNDLLAAGVAIHYLAYPREGLDSDSYRKAVSVWCSEDRQGAMTAAKAGKKVTAEKCENPVADHYLLGEKIGVSATPTVLLQNGRHIGGYIPADELVLKYLKE